MNAPLRVPLERENERREELVASIRDLIDQCNNALPGHDEGLDTTLNRVADMHKRLQALHIKKEDGKELEMQILAAMELYRRRYDAYLSRVEKRNEADRLLELAEEFQPIADQRAEVPEGFHFATPEEWEQMRTSKWKLFQDTWVRPEDRIVPDEKYSSVEEYDALPYDILVFDQTLLADKLVRDLGMELPDDLSKIEKQIRKHNLKGKLIEVMEGVTRISELVGEENPESRVFALEGGKMISFQKVSGTEPGEDRKKAAVFEEIYPLRRALTKMNMRYEWEVLSLNHYIKTIQEQKDLLEKLDADDPERVTVMAELGAIANELRDVIDVDKEEARKILVDAAKLAGSRLSEDPQAACELMQTAIEHLQSRFPRITATKAKKSKDLRMVEKLIKDRSSFIKQVRKAFLVIYESLKDAEFSKDLTAEVAKLTNFGLTDVEPFGAIQRQLKSRLDAILAAQKSGDLDGARKNALVGFVVAKLSAIEYAFQELIARTADFPDMTTIEELKKIVDPLTELVTAREIDEDFGTGLHEVYDDLEKKVIRIKDYLDECDKDRKMTGNRKIRHLIKLHTEVSKTHFNDERQDAYEKIGEMEQAA